MTEGSTRAYQFARQLQMHDWEPIVIGPPAVTGLDELHVETKGRGKRRHASRDEPGDEAASMQEQESGFSTAHYSPESLTFPVYHVGEALSLKGMKPARALRIIRGMPDNPISALKRGVNGLFSTDASDNGWEKSAKALAEQVLEEHPDIEIIYAQGPPVTPHVLGLELSGKYNKPLVLDCLEPYDVDGGESVSGMPLHQRLGKLEDQVLHSGQALIMPSRAMKVLFLKKYFGRLSYDDISIVRNGYDPEEIDALSGMYQPGPVMRWVFLLERAGRKELAAFFASLAALLTREEGLRGAVSFAFAGSQRCDALEYVRKLGLDDVVSSSWCHSREAELNLCMQADVCGVVIGQGDMNGLFAPERFFDVIGMKKPLFGVVPEGIARQMITDAGGTVVPVDRVADAGSAIMDLVRSWQAGALNGSSDAAAEAYSIAEPLKILIREIGYRLLLE